eukprot:1159761-Pelagomonas_calceolata.AAC.4
MVYMRNRAQARHGAGAGGLCVQSLLPGCKLDTGHSEGQAQAQGACAAQGLQMSLLVSSPSLRQASMSQAVGLRWSA